jgi:2-C-methyl-D-erythritol 4-phosphate cytidylyltransferase
VPSPRDVGVVIVAAGQGTRFGSDTPKQFIEIAGVPMLLRAIRPFARHPSVAHVAVVLRAADAVAPPAWLLPHVGAMLSVVAGGAERTDSVAAGLAALPDGCHVVLVHDAARPFVDAPLIDRVIDGARAGHVVVPALPVTDTIKEMDAADPERIARTVPRGPLRRVQTPQGFPRRVLEDAHAAAHARGQREGRNVTDDAALVEQMGGTVRIVAGDPRNLKVTTVEDLELAEYQARRGT